MQDLRYLEDIPTQTYTYTFTIVLKAPFDFAMQKIHVVKYAKDVVNQINRFLRLSRNDTGVWVADVKLTKVKESDMIK